MIRNSCLVLALALAILFTPLKGVPFANGPPLDSLWDLLIVAILVGALFATAGHPMREGPWVMVLVLAVIVAGAKTITFQSQLPHGLVGRYRTEPPGVGPPWERTLHQSIPNATRIDGPLAFHNIGYRPGRQPFPFSFLNDSRRHPWIGTDPSVQPTVHVTWEGYLLVESPGRVDFRLDTPDACGLTLDDQALIPPGTGQDHCARAVEADLEAGPHKLQVTYAQHFSNINAPSPQSRLLFQWRRGKEPWETVPANVLLPFEPTDEALEKDQRTRPLVQGLFVAQFILLVIGLGLMVRSVPGAAWRGERGQIVCWGLLLVVVALALTLRYAQNPSSNYLWLGTDDIDFVTEARAYITDSWLTIPSNGHERKIVYAYFLAAAHLVFGGAVVQMVFLQRLLLVSTGLIIYWIGKTTTSPRAGLFAMLLTVLSTQLLGWTRALYPATLAVFLLALALFCTLRGHRLSSSRWMLGAGLVMGLGIHTRPNFIPFIAVVVIWLAFTHRPWRRSLSLMGFFALGAGLIEVLARLRALAAYGTFDISQQMASINLARGNPIPPGVDVSSIPEALPFGLPKHLWALGAYATQKPLAFATLWLNKFLYLFGINRLGSVWNPRFFTYEIFFFSALGILGALLARRRYGRRSTLLPLAFAAANGLVLVITMPDHHGFRVLVPLIPMLAIYVGVVLESLDLLRPIQASWKGNLLRFAMFFALMPFRYGFQYALMGAAYLWPMERGRDRAPALIDELLHGAKSTSSLTPKPGPLQ